mgnify:CR=1 FL=1
MPERTERPQKARRSRKKVCMFCVDKVEHIDYKDTAKLRRYQELPRLSYRREFQVFRTQTEY